MTGFAEFLRLAHREKYNQFYKIAYREWEALKLHALITYMFTKILLLAILIELFQI